MGVLVCVRDRAAPELTHVEILSESVDGWPDICCKDLGSSMRGIKMEFSCERKRRSGDYRKGTRAGGMSRIAPVALGILLLALAVAGSADAPGEWELMKGSDTIKAYSRSVPGRNILDLKAITVIDARMENFGQVLRDLASYPRWMHLCKDARVIREIDENNMVAHITLGFPMINDRDLVVKADTRVDLEKARGIVTLSLVAAPDVPVASGVVRMPEFLGSYQLEYLSRDTTGVVFSYYADPGGSIPTAVVNVFSRMVLYRTLEGLARMVRDPKYSEAGRNSEERVLFDGILADDDRVRAILKARLMEYCKDEEMIDRAVMDENIFNLFIQGDGELARLVFFSWGSRENLTLAVQHILKIHARQYTRDAGLMERIAGDKTLVNTIIDGKKPGQPSALEILRSHLE